MSPLDYLRAMGRRRKPATGGLVRYDPDTPLYVGGGCVFPVPAASPPPVDVTISLHEPAPDEVHAALERVVPQMEQMADTMLAAARKQFPLRCPCAVIYSRCHYPVIHTVGRR